MIVRDKTNEVIEKHKQRLGITGDVYVVEGHYIESLESHKKLDPSSVATTIEDAELERIALLEQEREVAAQLAAEQEEMDKLKSEEDE